MWPLGLGSKACLWLRVFPLGFIQFTLGPYACLFLLSSVLVSAHQYTLFITHKWKITKKIFFLWKGVPILQQDQGSTVRPLNSIVPNHINFTVNIIIVTIKWSSALKWWLRQALKVSLNSINRKLWSLELFIMSTNEATDRLTDKLMKHYFSQCVNSSSRRCQLKLINVSWKLSKISIFFHFHWTN